MDKLIKNKPLIIGVALIAIIILAGAYFLLSDKNEFNPIDSGKKVSENNSILGLLGSGKTQECSFKSNSDENKKTSGTVYVSGENIRANISNSEETENETIYLIRRGDESFIWGDSFPNNSGIKMTLSLDEITSNDQTNEYINTNDKVDFDCKGWTVDSSVFQEPSEIQFMDFSGFLEGAGEMIDDENKTDANNAMCTACNNLTGESKNICLKQLNCQ